MISNSCVDDLKIDKSSLKENPFCKGCVLGKQHSNSFLRNEAIRAKMPGEIFYVDLCAVGLRGLLFLSSS